MALSRARQIYPCARPAISRRPTTRRRGRAACTASFKYSGQPPTSSFMRGLIEEAGYKNIRETNARLVWKITTTQTQQVVENGLKIVIKTHGRCTRGEIEAGSAAAAAHGHETGAGGSEDKSLS